jgi:hypothetical protein
MTNDMKVIDEAIKRTLTKMGRYSEQANTLLLMIAAHESMGGKYRKQIKGPALSVFQIEPVTHDSIWDNCDSIAMLSKKCGFVRDVKQLEFNDDYAVFVARCYLLMDKNPLPKTLNEMATYCKSYWNRTGKATAEVYMKDYLAYVKEA